MPENLKFKIIYKYNRKSCETCDTLGESDGMGESFQYW